MRVITLTYFMIILIVLISYCTDAQLSQDTTKRILTKIISDTTGADSVANLRKVMMFKNPVGTEFWLCFQRNYKETGNSSSDRLMLELFITGDWDAKVRIEIPAVGFYFDTLVSAGTVVNIKIPASVQINTSEIIEKFSIHVISNNPISVYGLNRRFQTTDTYLGLPVNVLGTEYRALCYTESKGLVSQVAIVATENNTRISIVPSANTMAHPRNFEYSVSLNKGDVFQIIPKLEPFSECDLTGTFIKADKKIAVFSGHQCSYVPETIIACNHLVEQLPPIPSWGRHFYIGKFKSRLRYTYRVLAHQDDTKVFENNNLVAELKAGDFFEKIDSLNVQLSATKPVLVAQYAHGLSDGDSIGDPMMILVSPTQQFLKSYRFATPVNGSWNHYINVIAPTSEIFSLRLNGNIISSSDFEQIGLSRYSIGQIKVPFGTHTITGNEPFGMYSYGFGYKGPLKDDAYDAYGTMGGQSFIEYHIEKDSIPPAADIYHTKDSNGLVIRDDRVDDSGIREVRIINDFGIETEVGKIMFGMPQFAIKLEPTVQGIPGRMQVEAIDAVLNKSIFTICYNFNKKEEKFDFYITEGVEDNCDVDPGLQIGLYGIFSANMNTADFSQSGGLNAKGKFGEAFSFGGFGGVLVGRHLQPDKIVSARIGYENNPATISAPDSVISKVMDIQTKKLRDFQEATDVKLNAGFLSIGFAFEWYFTEPLYLISGLNFSIPTSKDIQASRRIIIPEDWVYPDSTRSIKDLKSPEKLSSISNIRLSVFGGAGASYNFTYRISVFGEGIINHYFNDIINDGNWGLEQFIFHAGLRYRIF